MDEASQAVNAPERPGTPAAPDEAQPGLQRMAVRVGELNLLVPWDGGREVMPAPPTSRLPHTAPWLRGIANVRGALVPVVNLAAALGMARVTTADYLLVCGEGDGAMGLLIDGLPRVLNVEAANRIPDRPGLAPPLADCVIDAYQQDGRVWLDLDLLSLFESLAGRITPA